ncbi:MAG: RpiB/LacA/LacB family sugar-phosphate isomerase [Candidatus Peregrinibacteria bacterium]|nr:RpiB/LacA/LacB family sugar-phosphate isomerase [Candidatus Peregrinibacteria bacterium]MCB9807703.1 RpiB/LacA/LacB family sugar-phosphate isomerase [Candidatus Peribacteria bacterium]
MKLPDRIVLAADHAGFELKEAIKAHVLAQGIDSIDVQPELVEGDDYPEIIRRGCAAVLEYSCPGIIFGGSGNGEAMAANKVHGIRCALVYSTETAKLARSHNDANVMSLGGRLIDLDLAQECVDIFLTTDFEGGRHVRRIEDLE